jgi:hypothetical protein
VASSGLRHPLHKQFRNDRILIKKTIEDEKTGERFRNSMAVAQRFGLLEYDIQRAIETTLRCGRRTNTSRIVADRGR